MIVLLPWCVAGDMGWLSRRRIQYETNNEFKSLGWLEILFSHSSLDPSRWSTTRMCTFQSIDSIDPNQVSSNFDRSSNRLLGSLTDRLGLVRRWDPVLVVRCTNPSQTESTDQHYFLAPTTHKRLIIQIRIPNKQTSNSAIQHRHPVAAISLHPLFP